MSFELVTVKIEPLEFDTSVVVKQEVLDQKIKTDIDSPNGESQSDNVCDIKEEAKDIYPADMVKVEINSGDDVTKDTDTKDEVPGDFPCHLCGAAFQYLSHVTTHLNEHVRRTFPCPDCHREFIQPSDLAAHRIFHNVTKLYPCHICGEEFVTKDLLIIHAKEHTSEGAYECHICHRKLKSNYSLKLHISAVHAANKPFSCEECHLQFAAQWRLRQHMKLHTGDAFNCPHCDRQFEAQTKLDLHVLSHTGEKPIHCTMCDKRFTRNHNLKVHMRMHMGEKKFVCDFETCVKAFYTKSELTSHKAAVHSKDKPKPFKCTDCESMFAKKTQVRRHFISCHSTETPYSCEACKLNFKTKPKWKYHMMQHSDNKPFKCNVCSKGFLLKYQLLGHMKEHSDERPFSCEQCKKTFKSVYNVNRHVAKVHSVKKNKAPKPPSDSAGSSSD